MYLPTHRDINLMQLIKSNGTTLSAIWFIKVYLAFLFNALFPPRRQGMIYWITSVLPSFNCFAWRTNWRHVLFCLYLTNSHLVLTQGPSKQCFSSHYVDVLSCATSVYYTRYAFTTVATFCLNTVLPAKIEGQATYIWIIVIFYTW